MSDQPHKLGDVLRAAREAKGVDLLRAERDTKIRERYLSALERSEYRELPGAVYTKGFLRNYGAYLGLDPEYLVDLYRLETSGATVERTPPPSPPKPLAVRRSRAFVVTPGAVWAALLTLLVVAFVVYLGYEFINFARTPELRITDPAGDVAAHGSTTYLIRGVTEPNSRITVQGLVENPTITADAEGAFEFEAQLVPGSNVVTLVAFDPQTQRDSGEVRRTITVMTAVESPSPGTTSLELSAPADGASAAAGEPIGVAGTAEPGAAISVVATLTEPAAPSFSVVDGAGDAVRLPEPPADAPSLEISAADDGAFAGELRLPPGSWELTVGDGTASLVRAVTVSAPGGLSGELRIAGGQSYLEVDVDGDPLAGVSGGISDPGDVVTLDATDEIRVRAGNAGAVTLTINGIRIGPMGAPGAVVEWRINRDG